MIRLSGGGKPVPFRLGPPRAPTSRGAAVPVIGAAVALPGVPAAGAAVPVLQVADTLPIERGVPLPEAQARNLIRNTLRAMTPGDSIVVRSGSASVVYKHASDLGIKIRGHRLPDRSVRVWRIA